MTPLVVSKIQFDEAFVTKAQSHTRQRIDNQSADNQNTNTPLAGMQREQTHLNATHVLRTFLSFRRGVEDFLVLRCVNARPLASAGFASQMLANEIPISIEFEHKAQPSGVDYSALIKTCLANASLFTEPNPSVYCVQLGGNADDALNNPTLNAAQKIWMKVEQCASNAWRVCCLNPAPLAMNSNANLGVVVDSEAKPASKSDANPSLQANSQADSNHSAASDGSLDSPLQTLLFLSELFVAIQDHEQQAMPFQEREKRASLVNLGRMVPSITHEINNPLGVGLTSVSHLKSCLAEINKRFNQGELTEACFTAFIEECNEVAELLEYNIERAVGLVRDFKSNSVSQSADVLTRFNLMKHLNAIINSVNPALKSKQIHLQTQLNIAPELMILSYPGALFQVLTNLVFNALHHAFDEQADGNSARAATRQITVTVSHVQKAIEMQISDNGKGIDSAHKQQVFDPYFTTKKQAGGSGLGLSVVKSLVENKLNGQIQIDSVQGEGTHFWVTFPLSENSEPY